MERCPVCQRTAEKLVDLDPEHDPNRLGRVCEDCKTRTTQDRRTHTRKLLEELGRRRR